MKKLALMIACGVCYVCTCTLIYAQDSVAVSLNIDDGNKIRPTTLDVQIAVEGTAQLDYLKVYSTDKFAEVKLGYDEEAVATEIVNLKDEGLKFLKMTLKDLGGSTNWNQMWVSLNYRNQKVAIGDYLANAEYLDDGWFRVTIPVPDLELQAALQYVLFPQAFNANVGVKEITFAGDSSEFLWFGQEKYDNAMKENQPGQAELIFKNQGIVIDELRLEALTWGSDFVQPSMPYSSFHSSLLPGTNKFIGVVTDENANKYYSDTLTIEVPEGISYEVVPVSCYGQSDGSISVSIDGGLPPYTYSWSHGPDTQDASALSAGIYHVMVTDANGDVASATIEVKQPNPLAASLAPASCVANETVVTVSGGEAPYMVSLDDGPFETFETDPANVVWQVETNQIVDEIDSYNNAAEVETDSLDNVYVAGRYRDELTFGNGSVGGEGQEGTYLVKLNQDGSFAWSFSTLGGWMMDLTVGSDGTSTIIIDSSGPIVLVDYGGMNLPAGSYIINVDTHGNFQWLKALGRQMRNVSTDAKGNIYAIGRLFNPPNTGNGSTDLMLIKYDANGAMQWQKFMRGTLDEVVSDLYVSDNGDIFISGWFSGDIDFGGIKLESSGLEDLYAARLSSDGDVIWAISGGESYSNERAMNIAADGHGKVYLTVELVGNNIDFGGTVFSHPAGALAQLNASDGSVQWIRAYSEFYPPGGSPSYEVAVANQNEIYVSVIVDFPVFREGDTYDPKHVVTVLMQFDSTGSIKFSRPTGDSTYDSWRLSPIALTSDNHRIAVDYYHNFSIIKLGAAMTKTIENVAQTSVTVKDANNCTFTIDNPLIELHPPAPPVLCYVSSAQSGGGNVVHWAATDDPAIMEYNVYRETNALDNFDLIGTVNTGINEFADTEVDISERSYRYVLEAVDTCGRVSEFSNPHQTMHLTVNEGNRGQINLIWDSYKGFDYKSFKIYRGSSYEAMEMIAEVPSYLFTYTDLDPSPFTVYYQISVENDGSCTPDTLSGTSAGRLAESGRTVKSNIVTNYGRAGNLTLYPNPGLDHINVKFSPDGDEYQLKMIDAGGRVVRQIEGIFDHATIEKGALPSGIYSVIISKNSGKPMYGRIAFE